MGDQVFLDESGVTVTSQLLTSPDGKYSLDGVTSVQSVSVPAAASGPVLMIAIGAICVLAIGGEDGVISGVIGVALILGAGIWWTQKKPTFALTLRAPDREFVALESKNEEHVSCVVSAVQAAIASRDRT